MEPIYINNEEKERWYQELVDQHYKETEKDRRGRWLRAETPEDKTAS